MEKEVCISPLNVVEVCSSPPDNIPEGVRLIGAQLEWLETRGEGVKVAVLDTGSPRHPDIKVAGEVDFTGSSSGAQDMEGHGTHCAGIIAANGKIKGVSPEVSLYALKTLNDRGHGRFLWLTQGIRWCIENKMDVISLSLGGMRPQTDDLYHAIRDAHEAGIVIVAAAGNEGKGIVPSENVTTVLFPAAYEECIATAAVDIAKKHAPFSSHGYQVDIASFGVEVHSTHLNGKYARLSGTSMACPHITGAAALMIAKSRLRKLPHRNEHIRFALELYAEDIPPFGRDTKHGFGVFSFGRLNEEKEKPKPRKRQVVMRVGQKQYTVDGEQRTLLIAPRLVENRIMIGVRDLANIFDAPIQWIAPGIITIEI